MSTLALIADRSEMGGGDFLTTLGIGAFIVRRVRLRRLARGAGMTLTCGSLFSGTWAWVCDMRAERAA